MTAPDTDVTDLTEHLKTARAIAANLEAEIAGLDRRIASLEHADEKTPSDDMLAAELPSLETKRERARGASTKANVAAETARVAHANAAKNAANIPAGGTCANACEHCTVANAGQMYAAAKEAVKRLKAEWTIATRGHEVAVKDEQVISLAWEQATNAKARADAAAELADLRTRRSGLHPENVRADEQRILARIEASKAYAAAGITVAGLTDALRAEREQLAKVEAYQFPEPPATKVADLDARIANERTALHAAKVRDEFAVLTASQDLAHATWREHDLVVKALGPDGAIKELVATVVGPFLDAANAALAMLAPEWQVAIDPDDFGFVVQQPGGTCRASLLSKGSRWRLTAVLQIAVAQLAKVPLVIFDGVEDLDEVGGDGLSALVESCVGDGIQVLLLEHLDHGWTDDEDVTVVEIENGIAKSAGA